jgi:integrase
MRRGELFGLKWEDLDFDKRTIRIVRSLVDQIEGQPKTEASRKPLPMSDDLAPALSDWRKQSSYTVPQTGCLHLPCHLANFPTDQI